jgi:hypothetical protein
MGAHLFPQLLIAVVIFREADRPVDALWVALVGVWALALGLRGALWHQLGDRAADERAGLRTFAWAHPVAARRLGAYGLFPLELLAFGAMLIRAGSPIAIALVPAYALLELLRIRYHQVRLVVVSPAPRFRIAMHEYYAVLYPLAFLATATARDPSDGLVLLVHLALFPWTLARMLLDTGRAVRVFAAAHT